MESLLTALTNIHIHIITLVKRKAIGIELNRIILIANLCPLVDDLGCLIGKSLIVSELLLI
jgi:hypothetical protein